MLVLSDALAAIGQIGDPRFRSVLLRGLGLTLLLLFALYALTLLVVGWLLPDTLALPFIGQVNFLDDILSVASLLAMIVLSAFLMVPVASAFTGLFLDEVADAVEARHYPALASAPRAPFWSGVADAARLLATVVLANLFALVLYAIFPPVAPLVFWTMNGYLLGREYFQLVALRRLPERRARAMRRKHMPQIWLAGLLMAIPLTIPIVNLLVPILGAATFTHLFHRLVGKPPAPAEDP